MTYEYYRLYITAFYRGSSAQSFANIAELRLLDQNGNDVTQMAGTTYDASSVQSSNISSAFDGDVSTYWESRWSGAIPAWLMVHFTTPQEIHEYKICPRNYGGNPDRPITFEFQGSNDGTTWDTLDSQTNLINGWTAGVYRTFPTRMKGLKKYVITSTDTSGSYAAIKVETYINNVLWDTLNMPYGSYSGNWAYFNGLIRVGYNVGTSLNWTCEILGNIQDYTVGNKINWSYAYSQSLTLWEVPTAVIRYLIESQGDYYALQSGTLVNVGSTLNAQLFLDEGMLSLPDWDDYSSLTDPSVLCWCDQEERSLTAVTTGVPADPQVIISQNIQMTHSSITGIDSVEITSDSNTLFAMSFDNGSTWWNYVNDDWVQLTTQTSGQSKDSVEDIPTNAWNAKATSNQIKFRFVLLDETGYVTKIQVNYTN